MNELLRQLLNTLRGMWHRRWIGLAAAWIAAVVGIAVAYRIPERYEASARVFVDTQTLLKPLMAGLSIQPNVDEQVLLISRTLISRPNVDKLVRMADLDLATQSRSSREELIDNVLRESPKVILVALSNAQIFQAELLKSILGGLQTDFVLLDLIIEKLD